MVYQIKSYHRKQAKRLGVSIKPSTNAKKKLDVFKGDKKVASIGATGYKDFKLHEKEKGIIHAKERQRLYKIRHGKTSKVIGSPSYFASNILW